MSRFTQGARHVVQRAVRNGLDRAGYELSATVDRRFDAATATTIAEVRPYTMTSPERVAAVCDAVRHVDRYRVPGAIVECGVWRGGSSMAALRTLLQVGDTAREVYLFDTFEGMSEPTSADVDPSGAAAADLLAGAQRDDSIWCEASLEEVRSNVASIGYPPERLHFVEGKVEETIPDSAPDEIAILRLDTDWYESTRHELEHLMDRVSDYGVLIIDDYGHWQGARRAVDEFLAGYPRPLMLTPIDYTGRVAMVGARRR